MWSWVVSMTNAVGIGVFKMFVWLRLLMLGGVFASRGSGVVGCLVLLLPGRTLSGRACRSWLTWGNTGGAARWCSRWFRAARDCTGRRGRLRYRPSPGGSYGRRSPCPDPTSTFYAGVGGKASSWAAIALFSASAVRLPGRAASIRYRVLGSTRAATAVTRFPTSRSPSQCPASSRVSTTPGRAEIKTGSLITPWPLPRRCPVRGVRAAQRVRRHRHSSLRSTPR